MHIVQKYSFTGNRTDKRESEGEAQPGESRNVAGTLCGQRISQVQISNTVGKDGDAGRLVCGGTVG